MRRFHLIVIAGLIALLSPSFSIAQELQLDHNRARVSLLSYINKGAVDSASIREKKRALAMQWIFGKNLEKYDRVFDKYVDFKSDGSLESIHISGIINDWKAAGYPEQTYEIWRFHKYGGRGYVRSEAIKEIKKVIADYKTAKDKKYFEHADALQNYLDKNIENDEALKALMSEYYLKEFDEHLFSSSQAIKLVAGFVEKL